MSITDIKSVEQYDQLIKTDRVSVVLFSVTWADQCTQVRSVLAELAKRQPTGQLQYLDVPAEDLADISLAHEIVAVPTVIFFRSGKAIDRVDGVDVAQLTAKANQLAGQSASAKSSLDDRLRALVGRANVMIFMKGDRNTPRCGFSRELIRIVNETGVPYDTFDILTDEEVRQGLKAFSDWPTYPQVYVKSELIGGLDIIKEMVAGDELKSALTA